MEDILFSKRTFITYDPTIGVSEGNMTYYRVGSVHAEIPNGTSHRIVGISCCKDTAFL